MEDKELIFSIFFMALFFAIVISYSLGYMARNDEVKNLKYRIDGLRQQNVVCDKDLKGYKENYEDIYKILISEGLVNE